MVSPEILLRKAPRNMAMVNPKALDLLNKGVIPTLNLVEWLSVDLEKLLHASIKNHVSATAFKTMLGLAHNKHKMGVNALHRELGIVLGKHASKNQLHLLAASDSDVVRGWIAWAISTQNQNNIDASLGEIKPFAADPHFSVRELAWMAVRDTLAKDMPYSLKQLIPFALSKDEYVRRFASEVTRPCGVWCRHIPLLKEKPQLADSLLDSLSKDESRYVQNSVGNWLNDAGKSKPEWVLSKCRKWQHLNAGNAHTAYITKRAIRNL